MSLLETVTEPVDTRWWGGLIAFSMMTLTPLFLAFAIPKFSKFLRFALLWGIMCTIVDQFCWEFLSAFSVPSYFVESDRLPTKESLCASLLAFAPALAAGAVVLTLREFGVFVKELMPYNPAPVARVANFFVGPLAVVSLPFASMRFRVFGVVTFVFVWWVQPDSWLSYLPNLLALFSPVYHVQYVLIKDYFLNPHSFVSICILILTDSLIFRGSVYSAKFMRPFEEYCGFVLGGYRRNKFKKDQRKAGKKLFVKDFDKNRNQLLVNRWLNDPSRPFPELRALTYCGDFIFPFPVYCDEKAFHAHILSEFECIEGKVIQDPDHIRRLAIILVGPKHIDFGKIKMLPYAHSSNAGLIGLAHVVPSNSLTYAFVEETCKVLAGGPWFIILAEMLDRARFSWVVALHPLWFHLVLWTLPFPVAVILHMLWNKAALQAEVCATTTGSARVAINSISQFVDENESTIADVSYYLDVFLKITERNVPGLILSLGQRPQVLVTVLDAFSYETSDIEGFVTDVILSFTSESTDEGTLVMLAPWHETRFGSVLKQVLPKHVISSPTFSAGATLVAALLAAGLSDKSEFVRKIVATVEEGLHLEKIACVSAFGTFFTKIVEGIQRVLDTGNLWEFFEENRITRFSKKVSILSREVKAAKSKFWLLEQRNWLITEIDHVIGANPTGLVLTYLRTAETLVDKIETLIRKEMMRPAAFPVMLLGPPGVAKSSQTAQLSNLFSQIDGEERQTEDAMTFSAQEKYPAPADVNPPAVKYVYINDMEQITKDYPNRSLMALNVVYQQLLDNFPCSINNSVAEKKGLLYTGLKAVFGTGNHRQYAFSGETDRLDRRFASGVSFWKDIVDDKGVSVPFSTFSTWPIAKRIDQSRYTVLRAECSQNIVSFVDTEVVLNNHDFFSYVARRYREFRDEEKRKMVLFYGPSPCACGQPVVAHYASGVYKSLVNDLCDYDPPESVAAGPTTLGYLPDSVAYLGSISLLLWVVPLLGYVLAGTSLMLLALLSFFFYHVYQIFDKEAAAMILIEHATVWAARNYAPRVIKTRSYGLAKAYVQTKWLWTIDAFSNFEAAVAAQTVKDAFGRRFNYFLVLGPLACAAALTYYLTKTKVETLGKPLFPEQLATPIFDPKLSRERNYPQEFVKAKGWASKENEIAVVKLAKANVGEGDLFKVLSSACQIAKICPLGGTGWECRIIFLSPQLIAFNKHYLESAPDRQPFSLEIPDLGIMHFNKGDEKWVEGSEMVTLFHHFSLMPHNITYYMPEEFVSSAMEVSLDGVNWHLAEYRPARNLRGVDYPVLEWLGEGKKGDCSTLVLGRLGKGKCFLVGAVSHQHDTFLTSKLGCTLMSRNWYTKMFALYADAAITSVTVLGHIPEVGDLSMMSELRANKFKGLFPIGTVAGGTSTFKSKMQPTLWHDALAGSLSEPYSIPKKLRGMVGDVYQSAWTNTFKNMNLDCNLTESEMNAAIDDYLEPYESFVRTNNINLSPMTSTEGLFGAVDIGVSRVDFKTSTGYDLKYHGIRNKYQLFQELDDGMIQLKDLPAGRLKEVWQLYGELRAVVMVTEAVPKDEVRPTSKVDAYKIRLFAVMDAIVNWVGRCLLMPVMQVLLASPELSECYGAINAGGQDWHDLAERLLEQPFHFDADFSSYDTSHSSPVFRMFSLCMQRLSKICGYTDHEADMVYVFCFSFRWQLLKYLADLIAKFKGMPSGVIITLIMNSVVNSLLARVVFKRLVKEPVKFREKIRLGTVGDDNVQGVASDVSDRYNMLTVAPEYLKLGYVVTPATKDSVPLKFIPFAALSFLKRSFRMEERVGMYQGPLAKDSLYKSLSFQKMDSGIPPLARLKQVAEANCGEAYLHGVEYYAEFVKLVESLPGYGTLVPCVLPTYEELEKRFLSGTLTSEMLSNQGSADLPTSSNSADALCMPVDRKFVLLDLVDWDPASSFSSKNDNCETPRIRSHSEYHDSASTLNTNSGATVSDDIAANSTVVQDETVMEMVPLRRLPHLVDSSDEFAAFTSHPTLIHHMTWNLASTSFVIGDDILTTFLADVAATPLGKKFANFFWLRCRIKLKVVVQGSAYSYGLLRLSARPLPKNVDVGGTAGYSTVNNYVNSSIVPHVSIDPSKSEAYELLLDCPTISGRYERTAGTSSLGSYQLECNIINPLRSGTATVPTVSVCVYMSLDDVQLEGLTMLSGEPGITTMLSGEFQKEHQGGFLSSMFAGVSTVSSMATSVFPAVAPQLSIFSTATGAIGSVLRYFGFARPPNLETSIVKQTRPHANYFQYEGRDDGWVLAGSDQTSLPISPGFAGGTHDHMLISNIISIPGLILRDFQVTQAFASGDLVTSFYVHPTEGSTTEVTPLAGVARAFNFWTGDITARFEFCASVFHRATLLIGWDPSPTATTPNLDEALQTVRNVTVNIVGNTVVDITIPFKQLVDWAKVEPSLGTATPGTGTTNGKIFVRMINPVVANGSTDAVAMNVYLFSRNMSFAVPSPNLIAGQSQERTTMLSNEPSPLAPSEGVSFGGSQLGMATGFSFGEKYVTLKQLIGRTTIKYTFNSTTTALLPAVRVTVPCNPYRRTTGSTAEAVTFLDYFASAFVGYRGGFRFTVLSSNGLQSTKVKGQQWFSTPSSAGSTLITVATAYGGTNSYAGATVIMPHTGQADFTVPSMVRGSFNTTAVSYPSHGQVAFFDLIYTEGAIGDTTTTVLAGAADDGVLVQFIGFPAEA
jgi:hypothetical protein